MQLMDNPPGGCEALIDRNAMYDPLLRIRIIPCYITFADGEPDHTGMVNIHIIDMLFLSRDILATDRCVLIGLYIIFKYSFCSPQPKETWISGM